ncbi:MAG TPA: ATP-binding protein [Acetobacteraceae bacterium]|nr:ATP-binding protein [Acetobacteraceae bacterium]
MKVVLLILGVLLIGTAILTLSNVVVQAGSRRSLPVHVAIEPRQCGEPWTMRSTTRPATVHPRMYGNYVPAQHDMRRAEFQPEGVMEPASVPKAIVGRSMNWRSAVIPRVRAERSGVRITMNLAFGEWPNVFGDTETTTTLLVRLTPYCHVIKTGTRAGASRTA